MRSGALIRLVARDIERSLRTFAVAAVGIIVGIATLAFFVALGAGMKAVVLGRIFPIDRIEVAPQEASAGGVVGMLGGDDEPSGISADTVHRLRALPGVRAVYPKMRLVFPSSGRGGRAIFGRDVGTGELVVEGIEPGLVRADLRPGQRFEDPGTSGTHRVCANDGECTGGEFCDVDLANDGHPQWPGQCAPPIPAMVSPYLVEVFNGAIAPAHHLPPIGDVLVHSAEGLLLEWDLGRAGLGTARQGRQRRVHVRIVGVSSRAIDLGFTVPIDVARRMNREFAGVAASELFTSASVVLATPSDTPEVTSAVRGMGLEVKTSGAEQMGLLVAVITAVLSLTSVIVVVVAALNIAHVFFTMIAERRGEIGLMRALGASRGDVRAIVIVQAAAVGLFASACGLGLARLAAFGANRFAARRLPPFPFKPDDWFAFEPKAMAIVVLFGLGACVLSALAPAARAARIEPADALAGGV